MRGAASDVSSQFILGLFLADLVHVGGGYHTGGKSDDRYADKGGYHCDEPADVGGGVDISIADGGDGDGGPVKRIEEVCKQIRLKLENQHC